MAEPGGADTPTPPEPGPAAGGGARAAHPGPGRQVSAADLWHAFVRPGWSQLVVGLLVCVVAMSAVLLARARAESSPYQHASRADLIQMLDSLNQESRRLEKNRSELEITLAELESGVNKGNVARKEAARRQQVLSVLAGTSPAHGPGIEVTLYDPQNRLAPGVLLDCLHELRDAGAEVMEINDKVRVVASTWIAGGTGQLVVDGTPIQAPVRIKAIGEPHALAEGVRFRGGIVSQVEGPEVGGSATVTQVDNLVVSAVVATPKLVYATPRR